ncbi:MAG: three-Cys-motif partner protein TcmP [Acidisphaera sp.]|nr:three-Cys-motif partner protein TcmP [Acidisphaera sp.]
MASAPEHYAGREQAYVKHFFLRNYFSDLIHKIASAYDEFVYVDGFAGPWQSADDRLGDTSLGIALAAMRSAREAWTRKGRNVRMHAMLVEKRAAAFRDLQRVPANYPDIDVRPFHGEFVPLVPRLLREMPPKAFAFLFIDPKGWRIDINAVAPLLHRPNTEVLFNFMFDFINRAASISGAPIVEGLNALIPVGDWRERLISARALGSRSLADVRKEILVDAFSQTVAKIGGYEFVAETPVFRTLSDRTLYSLIYATRKAPGIEVFRRAQTKTLREQEKVRRNVRQAKDSGPQTEAFSGLGNDCQRNREISLFGANRSRMDAARTSGRRHPFENLRRRVAEGPRQARRD